LTYSTKRFFRPLAELFRCRTKSSFPGDNPDWNTLRLRRKTQKFYPIAKSITKRVRSEGSSRASIDGGENPRPTVVLLHDARFILHSGEGGREVYPVLRKLLMHQSNERFARRLSQGDGLTARERMVT